MRFMLHAIGVYMIHDMYSFEEFRWTNSVTRIGYSTCYVIPIVMIRVRSELCEWANVTWHGGMVVVIFISDVHSSRDILLRIRYFSYAEGTWIATFWDTYVDHVGRIIHHAIFLEVNTWFTQHNTWRPVIGEHRLAMAIVVRILRRHHTHHNTKHNHQSIHSYYFLSLFLFTISILYRREHVFREHEFREQHVLVINSWIPTTNQYQ